MPHTLPPSVDNLVKEVHIATKRWCSARQQMLRPVGVQRQVRVKLSGNKESDLARKPGGGQKGRRKQLLPGELEVWENRLYVTKERDRSQRAEVVLFEHGAYG